MEVRNILTRWLKRRKCRWQTRPVAPLRYSGGCWTEDHPIRRGARVSDNNDLGQTRVSGQASTGRENFADRSDAIFSSRVLRNMLLVSGNLGPPGATTYDPMHLCLLLFALLSVSRDVWASCQWPTGCRGISGH